MEFRDVVRKRRMIRNFEDRPVPREIVDRILDTAIRAPSAGFSQGWAFLVLDDAEALERFWAIEWPREYRDSPHAGITRAPVLVIPYAHKQAYLDRYAEPDKGWTDKDEARWPVPFWLIDTAMASMLALLAVVDEDLGALFFGVRQGDDVRKAFGVPDELEAIGAIAIGYRAPDVASPSLRRGRRGIEAVVHRGRWEAKAQA